MKKKVFYEISFVEILSSDSSFATVRPAIFRPVAILPTTLHSFDSSSCDISSGRPFDYKLWTSNLW